MREETKVLYGYRFKVFLNTLKSKLASRPSYNPDKKRIIQKIGLLFDATEIDEKNEVLAFAKILENAGTKVNRLGYLDHSADTGGIQFWHFNNSNRTFYFIPSNYDVDRFMDLEFDMLINADLSQSLSLHYIAILSKAYIKVGPHSIFDEYYHLILDTRDTLDIKQYLRELISILNKVSFNGKLIDKRSRDSAGNPI